MVQSVDENELALLKTITGTLASLEDIRRPYEAHIDEILTYIYHGRRRILEKDSAKGAKTGIQVYDDTALRALNLLTDGLTGYTVSRSFKWFGYSLPHRINFARTSPLRNSQDGGRRLDSFPEVKGWLEDAEEAMYAAYLASNLYDVAPEVTRDAASIGTVTTNIDEDVERGRIIFSVPHFRECYCAENAFGMIDTNFRVYKLTLKQLVEKFGYATMLEKIGEQFRQDYEKNIHAEREVVHARYPRRDYDPEKLNKKNKPFASVWVLKSPLRVLGESGTDNPSFVTWRWRKNSDEWYGRSPASDAFVSAMTANQIAKTNLIAGHKMVEPPMAGMEALRGSVQRGPKGWTSLTDMNMMPRVLQENIQLPFALNMQDRIDEKIKEHFHVDFFLMLSQAALQKVELTATQVIEMSGEKAAVLGPRIGRMETEHFGPIHDTVFAIEYRAGRIPPPPQILLDVTGSGRIEVEYLGPLAQAQKKLFMSQGIQQGLEALSLVAQVFPSVLDHVDEDKTAIDLLLSRGFPQKDLRSPKSVEAVRNMRQQALEHRQQLEESIQVAKAMPAAGKGIDPNSAAAMLMREGQ
jgi:hypothetical protein